MEPPRRRLRVRSIPAGHPYVRQALPVDTVEVLDDPTTPWWPPLAFDPEWFAAHGIGTDVVHVHFGFEHVPPDELRRWCVLLAQMRIPLVVTVHDLRNPHLTDHGLHDAQLAVLLQHAAAVITLTQGAAQRIRATYGVCAWVVAHPAMIDPEHPLRTAATTNQIDADGSRRSQPVVGINLGTGRANLIDPAELVPPVALAARAAGATLTVCVRGDAGTVAASAARIAALHDVRLVVDDGELTYHDLHQRLLSWHVAVLPYRFGTHSGWVELCRDLGVGVVAPDCGFYAEQWPEVHSYTCSERTGLMAGSLVEAVSAALSVPSPSAASRPWRRAQRHEIRRAHETIYADVARVGARSASVSAP